jgi:anti-sigma regulatory factor (Ser/Thr protein kinase)
MMVTASSEDEAAYGNAGFRVRMDGGLHAAGRARREMARLDPDVEGPLLESIRLLVTELVSNSVRHAGATTLELSVAVRPASVRVEVANAGRPFEPSTRATREDADSGWGLYLVDELSQDWGVVEQGGCQRVWFELARTR